MPHGTARSVPIHPPVFVLRGGRRIPSSVISVSDRFPAGFSVAGTDLGSRKTPPALAYAGLSGTPGRHPPVAVLTRRCPCPRSVLVSRRFWSAHPSTAHLGETCASRRSRAWSHEDGEFSPPRMRCAPLENILLPCADHSREPWCDTLYARSRNLAVRLRSWVPARESSLRSPLRQYNECLAGSRRLGAFPSFEQETCIREGVSTTTPASEQANPGAFPHPLPSWRADARSDS